MKNIFKFGKILFTIGTLIFSVNLISQVIIFEKTYNFSTEDRITDIAKLPDGNLMLIGSAINSNGIKNILIIKVDSNGDTLLTRVFNYDSIAIANNIIQSSDGDFFITGKLGSKALLMKMNENADTLWTKVYVDETDCSFQNIIELTNSDLLVSEWIWVYPTTSKLLRLSNAGDVISSIISMGTKHTGLDCTSDEEIFLSGYEGESYNPNFFLKKYNSDDSLLFYKSYNEIHGTNSSLVNVGSSAFIGGYMSDNGIGNPVVIKTEESGLIEWIHTFPSNYAVNIISMALDDSNRIYNLMEDIFSNEVMIKVLDVENNQLGVFTFECIGPQMERIITENNHIYIGGSVLENNNDRAAYLVKLNADSILTQVKTEIYLKNSIVQVFPNPVKEFLQIRLLLPVINQEFSAKIINNLGKELYKMESVNSGEPITLEIRNLESGIYFLKIDIGGYGSFTEKIVVTR